MDIACPEGTPIYAPAGGRVVDFVNSWTWFNGQQVRSFGNAVCLDHEHTPWYSLYGHMTETRVSVGDVVDAGDLIGISGATGVAYGAHLHWQVCRSAAFPVDITLSADPASFYQPEDPDMTDSERRLLLACATLIAGRPTGQDFADVDDALGVLEPLAANDNILLLGLGQLWKHRHNPNTGEITLPAPDQPIV